MKRRVLLTGGVGVAAATAGAWWALHRHAVAPANALWSMQFEQPQGGALSMASLRGQPLLLNFRATWCAPCEKEMPLLDRFQRAHQERGWRVVGLAVDSVAPVRDFLSRLPVSFAIGLTGSSGVELSRRLGNSSGSLPFTVVFDRSGQAIDRKLGAVHETDLAGWESRIR
jgi:thiol-disulfide isomerase/thioredoxin